VMWVEYWRAAAHDASLAQDSREVNALWLSLLAECITDGIESGQFTPEGTALEAAVELHSLLDGLGLHFVIEHPADEAAEAIKLLERAARRMLQRH
jgi:BetI-type transcriptional repressor, C-terminal